ncbi:hypothetical protein PVAP13_4KG295805 [Panicum virgatum]|uniref:Uncharacterized protein n=1 Tax=Panicum virgatum TaxID=38727 RepID=A0A8T0TRY6_PANVG|nr:hypothetical protein PVAP13_4KG295805 [Panicum virgatum]
MRIPSKTDLLPCGTSAGKHSRAPRCLNQPSPSITGEGAQIQPPHTANPVPDAGPHPRRCRCHHQRPWPHDRKLLYNPRPDRQNRSRGKSHRIHRHRRSDKRQEKSGRRLFHHAWGSSSPAPLRRTSRGTHTSPEDHQGPPGAKEAAMDPSTP